MHPATSLNGKFRANLSDISVLLDKIVIYAILMVWIGEFSPAIFH